MQFSPTERPDGPQLYFAYGSNLNRAEMRMRCPGSKPFIPAQLSDWRLTFRGVADIEPAEGRTVLGAIWFLTAPDVRSLDRYEGAPSLYSRRPVRVETSEGPKQAFTYVMCDPDYRGLPSESYLARIGEGYRDWALPLGPLVSAVRETREELAGLGITRFRPDGRKRLRGLSD